MSLPILKAKAAWVQSIAKAIGPDGVLTQYILNNTDPRETDVVQHFKSSVVQPTQVSPPFFKYIMLTESIQTHKITKKMFLTAPNLISEYATDFTRDAQVVSPPCNW